MSELLLTFMLNTTQAKECNAFYEKSDDYIALAKDHGSSGDTAMEYFTKADIYNNKYIACVIKHNTKIKDEK